MKLKLLFSLAIVLLLGSGLKAQSPITEMETDSLNKYEMKLKKLSDSILDGSTQMIRIRAVTRYIPLFVKTLKFKGSFDYPFDSLIFMKKLVPPDRKFRLYSWAVKFDDGTYRYYAAIHMNRSDSLKIIPLRDYSDKLDTTLDSVVLTKDTWLGALYYQIIQTTYKKNTYYTLLGWDGNNNFSMKKVIEVLTFSKSGVPQLGAFIFKINDKVKSRMIYEYGGNAEMLLNYLPEEGYITLDSLSPTRTDNEDQPWTYVPSGAYMYFIWKKGHWIQMSQDMFHDVKKPIKELKENDQIMEENKKKVEEK